MAKPNYQREKRQKELTRKKKKEEKKLRKQEKTDTPPQSGQDLSRGQNDNG